MSNPLFNILGTSVEGNVIKTIKSFLSKGGTTSQLIDIVSKTMKINNPQMMQLLNVAKGGNMQELEKLARQTFSEQGRDFDNELAEFLKKYNR